jgi:hypothetical protein
MGNDVPSATGQRFPSGDQWLSAAEGAGALDDDIDPNGEASGDDDRLSKLPAEERDDDRTVGAGIMDEGGTAVARGTGTLGGQAQGGDAESDDDDGAKELDDTVAFPTEPGGGTR